MNPPLQRTELAGGTVQASIFRAKTYDGRDRAAIVPVVSFGLGRRLGELLIEKSW